MQFIPENMSKTLFITGGNGEIGGAIVDLFSSKGYRVFKPSSRELDCRSKESINEFFDNMNIPEINSFIHCAGINSPKFFNEVTEKSILESFNINTLSFLYISQRMNFLDNESRIVALSSIYGTISRTKRIEYSTSKHALNGMVQTLALELASRNILVNAVSPGFIATKLTFKNNSEEVIKKLICDIPLKKLGRPDYIAELVYFLCSEKNQFITGQNLTIDGGYLIGGFQS